MAKTFGQLELKGSRWGRGAVPWLWPFWSPRQPSSLQHGNGRQGQRRAVRARRPNNWTYVQGRHAMCPAGAWCHPKRGRASHMIQRLGQRADEILVGCWWSWASKTFFQSFWILVTHQSNIMFIFLSGFVWLFLGALLACFLYSFLGLGVLAVDLSVFFIDYHMKKFL